MTAGKINEIERDVMVKASATFAGLVSSWII